MNRRTILIPILVVIVTSLLGCTAHSRRVDCEGHLQPINPAGSAPVNTDAAQ